MTTQPLTLLHGDCLAMLKTLPDQSVQCCVTSPPYYGLRDYGVENQIGLEESPEAYVAKLVEVFRDVRRVLRDDGTLWLNLGDSYNAYNGKRGSSTSFQSSTEDAVPSLPRGNGLRVKQLGNKQLIGIPWRVAFALQADGWYLRQDIIWHKKAPMPESVTDRCTKAHEYIFLLTKNARYFYDAEAISEQVACDEQTQRKKNSTRNKMEGKGDQDGIYHGRGAAKPFDNWKPTRNRRSVWSLSPSAFAEAHFATFPPELPRTCILAGTSARGACATCGAPFTRVMSATLTAHDGKTESQYASGTTANRMSLLRQAARERGEEYQNTKRTLCWRPTCRCSGLELLDDEAPVPTQRNNEADADFQTRHTEWLCNHERWKQKLADLAPRYEQLSPAPCVVLDPFNGSGTTGMVAIDLGRHYIGIDLNAEYIEMARRRIAPALAAPPLPLAV